MVFTCINTHAALIHVPAFCQTSGIMLDLYKDASGFVDTRECILKT